MKLGLKELVLGGALAVLPACSKSEADIREDCNRQAEQTLVHATDVLSRSPFSSVRIRSIELAIKTARGRLENCLKENDLE